MLYLLLTYDYELFFNKCFASEEEVLINPTYDIAKALSNEGVSATFFVDTPSITAYLKLGLKSFPDMVKEQVNALLNMKHDVQLHIHPIWNNAEYRDGEWLFNNDYYSLKSFKNVEEIIRDSKRCLDLLTEGNPHYKCCAFRAGGFCYSPVKELTETLYELGIRIDSSVCKGMKMETFAQEFDYSKTPSKINWYFDSDNMFQETINNRMLEIPIGTYGLVPNKWMLTHCMPKLSYPPRKGLSTPTINKKRTTLFDKIIHSLNTPVLFTSDSLHASALLRIARYYEKKAYNKKIYIALIAHPKFSSKISVDNTISFIQLVRKNCSNTRFITMQEVAIAEGL